MTPRQPMRAAVIVVALVVPIAAWAQQQPGAQPAAAAQAAVTECAQAQSLAERTIDMTNRRIEAARQANSPAAMRAAIDDMQAALRQLRAEIAPCAGLQLLAAADPQGGHVMPSTSQAPVAAPRTPVMSPGSTVPAPRAIAPSVPASGGAAPRAGPETPATPQAPAPRATPQAPAAAPRAMPPRAPAAQPRSSTSAAPGPSSADPHAGHPAASSPARPPAAGTATPQTSDAPLSAVDPVCGLKVNPSAAPRATYQGQTYHFCSEQHRQLFLKDSAKYAPKERR